MGEDDYSGSEMGEDDYSGSEMGEGDYNSQDEKSGDDDQFEQVELEGRAGAAHNDDYDAEDSDREAADIDRYLAERKEHNEASSRDRCRQLRENLEFPDEIDTPADQPARERFQKYRGLQSFRTSSWDPYENLPLDYGRIVEFADFQKTRRQVLQSVLAMAKSSTNGRQMECQMERPAHVPPGHLISLHIRKVPEETIQAALLTAANSRPFVVFGLLPHEQKMSVVNFSCTRPKSTIFGSGEDAAIESNDESSMAINDAGDGDGFFNDQQPIVKSKDLLLIFCGFRRFHNRPIYSQNSGGSKQLHKYEEFLHTGTTSIGTMFAPVTFPPAPVTMFTLPSGKTGGDLPQFVGYGSVLRVDPARMIIKRRILTGHPTRIHKSSHRHTAVVKFMFFDPLDVEYFKPVELKTKYGRRGHIMDSVGTHGTMKCSFDRQLQQQDTVCLMLYKRVYPKWPVGGYKSLFADVERVE
jgi:pre-rRNA-processing protein TSR1